MCECEQRLIGLYFLVRQETWFGVAARFQRREIDGREIASDAGLKQPEENPCAL
jgi:hypothetical protein